MNITFFTEHLWATASQSSDFAVNFKHLIDNWDYKIGPLWCIYFEHESIKIIGWKNIKLGGLIYE